MELCREVKNGLTKEYLNELFEYKDGTLYWKIRIANCIQVGDEVKSTLQSGYIRVCIKRKGYRVNRLIWVMHYGDAPEEVDHRDGNKKNNRIENLRAANRIQNSQNYKTPKTNKSGVKNVCWNSKCHKWQVGIRVNGKSKHIGLYDDIKDAEKAVIEAREKYHGEFARHS